MGVHQTRCGRSVVRSLTFLLALLAGVLLPSDARASFLSPELEDKLATFLALFVLVFVPIVLIVLFWMVHILPEKIAHKRQHPQFEAIRTLCLLSLVFGGLLWPLAWIWAFTRPTLHKIAYGTDKHPDALTHELLPSSLHERVARLEDRADDSELRALRADLELLEAKYGEPEVR